MPAGSSDRTVKLWHLRAGMPVATSKLHGGPVRAVAMDATMLVSSGVHDRSLRVWEAGNQPGTEAAGGQHNCTHAGAHAVLHASFQAAGETQSDIHPRGGQGSASAVREEVSVSWRLAAAWHCLRS